MKVNMGNVEQQFAVMSSCARALDDLYDELIDLGASGGKPGIPFIVQLLTERIRESYRSIEADLAQLEMAECDDEGFIEIEILN